MSHVALSGLVSMSTSISVIALEFVILSSFFLCCCCAKPDIGFNLRYAHCAQSFLNGILKMCSRAQLETIYSLLKKNAQWQMREIKQSLSVSLKDQLGFNWILLKSIGIGIQHSTLPFLCSHFVLNGSKISGHERYTEHRVVSDSLLAKNNPYWQNPIFVFFCIALCSIVFN